MLVYLASVPPVLASFTPTKSRLEARPHQPASRRRTRARGLSYAPSYPIAATLPDRAPAALYASTTSGPHFPSVFIIVSRRSRIIAVQARVQFRDEAAAGAVQVLDA